MADDEKDKDPNEGDAPAGGGNTPAETDTPKENDPWGGDNEPEPIDPIQAALDPANPGKTGGLLPPSNAEPQIAVQSPEGTVLHVDASKQEQYEEMGFTVMVGAGQFGKNGTLTVGADPEQVEFGKQERKVALARLNRKS